MENKKLEVLAFYLPQFFPIKENDEWWGKGFTEWTNVAKAKPLYKGHNQPRIPADLGFYDLRVPEVREQQVLLAKEAGVTAFCYWHYWFGNGKRLLDRVFDEVLESGKPDFPFCLGWANHSWYAKTWNKDSKDKLLIEQTYPGDEDAKAHFRFLLKAFNDKRYVKVNGCPYLFIFDPYTLPESYIELFKEMAVEAGFPGLYLVANLTPIDSVQEYLDKGYSSVLINRTKKASYSNIDKKAVSIIGKIKKMRKNNRVFDSLLKIRRWCIESLTVQKPSTIDFKTYYKNLITRDDCEEYIIPQIMPQWDHTPRSGVYGLVWEDATPDYFYLHAKDALEAVKDKNNPIIVLKSWNEWGEGNYMEPDLKYGKDYIIALRKAIDEVIK